MTIDRSSIHSATLTNADWQLLTVRHLLAKYFRTYRAVTSSETHRYVRERGHLKFWHIIRAFDVCHDLSALSIEFRF